MGGGRGKGEGKEKRRRNGKEELKREIKERRGGEGE